MQLHLRVFHKMWIKNREAPLYLVVWMTIRQVTAQVGVSHPVTGWKPRDYAETAHQSAM